MSKYYKAEDVINLLATEYYTYKQAEIIEVEDCKAAATFNTRHLPTIEVSEDCISRADLFEKMQSLCPETDNGCGDCHKACDIEDCLDFVMDAPSVIPKTQIETQNSTENSNVISVVDNEDCISREYVKCTNCAENGSYKCSKCDGEMYYKYDKDEQQTYITEDRDTQILDAWQVHHRNTTTVEDAPSVVPSRAEGEWITEDYYHNTICSNCGAKETEFIYGTENWYGVGESKFCPNCGSRMRGEHNDE